MTSQGKYLNCSFLAVTLKKSPMTAGLGHDVLTYEAFPISHKALLLSTASGTMTGPGKGAELAWHVRPCSDFSERAISHYH